MDLSVGPSKEEYRLERAQRGRVSLIVSLLALIISAWTLFETALRWPTFDTYAGANWRYGRGTPTDDEVFIVPLTIANSGARPGAVLSIEMLVTRPDGGERRFSSAAVLQNDKDQVLFSPQTIQGQSAFAAPVVLTSEPGRRDADTRPVVDADGIYRARITVCTTYRRSLGIVDDLAAGRPGEVDIEIAISGFRLDFLASRPWTQNRLEVSAKTAQVPPTTVPNDVCSSRVLK